MKLANNFKEVLLAFNNCKVNYIIVGGYAVIFQDVKLGDEPIQVDIFNAITGVKFNEAEKNCITHSISGKLEVRFIHLDDLITNNAYRQAARQS